MRRGEYEIREMRESVHRESSEKERESEKAESERERRKGKNVNSRMGSGS